MSSPCRDGAGRSRVETEGLYARVGVWGLSRFKVKFIKNLFSSFFRSNLISTIKRVRQPNNNRRFDIGICASAVKKFTKAIKSLKGRCKILEENYKCRKIAKKELGRSTIKCTALTYNINGLREKLSELEILLEKENPEIIAIQETRMKGNTRPCKIKGYTVIEKKESSSPHSRGLALAIKANTDWRLTEYKSTENFLSGIIETRDNMFLVISIYVPNNHKEKTEALKKLGQMVIRETNKNKWKFVLILGDWNGDLSRTMNILSNHNVNATSGEMATDNTYVRGVKMIDFGLAAINPIILSQKVLKEWTFSDHFPVAVSFNACYPECTEARYTFKRPSVKKIKEILNCKSWDTLNYKGENSKDTRTILSSFCLLKEIKYLSWYRFSHKTRAAILKKNNLVLNKSEDKTIEEITILIKKLKRNDFTRNRLAWINKGCSQFKGGNHKLLWKWLSCNWNPKGTSSFIPIRNENDELQCSLKDSLKEFKKRFSNLSDDTEGTSKNVHLWTEHLGPSESIFYEDIYWTEIYDAMKNSKNNKAPGCNKIPVDFYKICLNDKDGKSKMANYILNKCRYVFNKSIIPDSWNTAIMVPIYKKGDPNSFDNYRGIALMDTLSKILMKIVNERILTFINSKEILIPEQTGFRKGEECISQAALLTEILKRRSLMKKQTVVCFLDFSKAYDNVPHGGLIQKLSKYGIGGKILQLIKNIYSNPKIKVKLGDKTSSSYSYKKGVKQGCPLSPLLFNLYINDILAGLPAVNTYMDNKKISGLLFADDTVLIAESHEDMNRSLSIIDEWCSKWKMKINSQKCGSMVFYPDEQKLPLKINGEEISPTNKYVYLGFTIDKNLNPVSHMNRRIQMGKCALVKMTPFLYNRKMPAKFKKAVIKAVLIPIVTYGIELCGMSSKRATLMENTISRATRLIVGASHAVNLETLYEELGIERIESRAAKLRLRAFYKWRHSETFVRNIYTNFTHRSSTWMTQTTRWLNRFMPTKSGIYKEDVKVLLKMLKERRVNKNKAIILRTRTDLLISSMNPLMKNLDIQVNFSLGFRTLLRLRTGSFMFAPILVARNLINSSYRRKCLLCECNVRENIKHLLEDCIRLDDKRNILLSNLKINTANSTRLLNGIISKHREKPQATIEVLKFLEELSTMRAIKIKLISDLHKEEIRASKLNEHNQ